jgi:ubiquinone biosynthesis monooxygenase Coq7
MNTRSSSLMDRIIGEIDKAIKVLTVPAQSARAPAGSPDQETLPDADRRTSARLMRVNHAGEVAAQALYQGQALTARNQTVKAALQQSAAEETDHLAWCEQRLRELQGRTSLLNPLWYVGSFAIGALAGALGDRASLGFVTETEAQVESHLRGHLDRLSPRDSRSRAILEQMQHDEIRHGENAAALGGMALPLPASLAMRAVSKLMTNGSYWI